MKHIRSFAAGFVIAIAAVFAVQAFAGVAGFRADLTAAFAANFTAPQRQAIANSFVSAYEIEWQRRVAAGTADTTANRGAFAIDKIIAYVQEVHSAERYKADLQSVPTPTPLPDTEE